MSEKLELRMYGLCPYQLTGIQKGIQFLHGVVEYSQKVNRIGETVLDTYNDWANNWKTVILLNGGTTNNRIDDSGVPLGTLNNYVLLLEENGIDFATFSEPDLGDQLTSVVFILDERVFNRKKYPDFEDWVVQIYGDSLKNANKDLAQMIRESGIPTDSDVYSEWRNLVGGEKNVFLRDFIKDFKLA